jgi:HTH-type transcriptional regulator/antitoxin HigA
MTKAKPIRVPDDYLDLVKRFPLRPLRSTAEYDAAVAILDSLFGRDDLSAGRRQYVDALATFVEEYDKEHYPRQTTSSPIELLREMLDQRGMNTTALGVLFGSKGVASEVLNGKRDLNLNQIYKLAGHFKVDPGVFLSRRPERASG